MNAIVILSLLLKAVVSLDRIPDADDRLHVYALPVGQGDCTVIQCPKNQGDPKKGIVTIIDAGASRSTNKLGMKEKDIVNFLRGTELKYVVITHSDLDHRSYIKAILQFYGKAYFQKTNIKKKFPVYHSCAWSRYGVGKEYATPQEVIKCAGVKECKIKLKLCPHQDFDFDYDPTLSFVASAYGGCKKAPNEDSIISKITYADRSTLITGDFELKDELMKTFLKKAGADLKSDIYRLSHHGAWNKKANQDKFLKAVGADYVFSSSAYKYGHPRCEIYEYYKKNLLDIVAKHPYTCFKNSKRNSLKKLEIRQPIYVTHLIRKNTGPDIKSYYLIKFNIDPSGRICVEFIHMGDEKKKIRKI